MYGKNKNVERRLTDRHGKDAIDPKLGVPGPGAHVGDVPRPLGPVSVNRLIDGGIIIPS